MNETPNKTSRSWASSTITLLPLGETLIHEQVEVSNTTPLPEGRALRVPD